LSSPAQTEAHIDLRRREIGDRALAAWEIVSVCSSVFIAEWMVAAAAGTNRLIVAVPIVLAFAFMIASHGERRESLKELGIRLDNFARASRLLLPPMLLMVVLLLVVGYFSQSRIDFLRWAGAKSLVIKLVLGVAWGLTQQYVLQAFINRRAMIVFGRGWASILLVAAIFAGLHLPNLWLAVITFAGGTIWALVYQRVPNLFALAISHSVMTWVVVSTVPSNALHHLRLGLRYFL